MGNRIVETRRFGARAGNEKAAQQFLSDVLKLSSMPLKASNDVRLAVEELFNNISSYAYGQDSGFLDLTVSVDDTACTVSVLISDEGRAFDPFAEDRHNTTGDPSLAGTPGLGILLVRRLMDGCSYQRARGRNETTIIKHWTTPRKNAEALSDAARVIRVMEGSEYNAPERSQRPLTDDDLTLVVGAALRCRICRSCAHSGGLFGRDRHRLEPVLHIGVVEVLGIELLDRRRGLIT